MQANAVGDEAQADVELLVSEIVTNVLRHENSLVVNVDVSVDVDSAVTVTVTGGQSAPSAPLIHPADRLETCSASGRGLGILDSLASAWGTRRQHGKTAVWFTVTDVEGVAQPDVARQPDPVGPTPIGPPTSGEAVPPVADLASVAIVVTEVAAGPVVAAAPAITDAIASAGGTQPSAQPEIVASQAAITAEQAATDAATMTADAARSARAARAAAAALAADAVAVAAARTVDAVQSQADEVAWAVAAAASEAAATVSKSIAPGGDAEAARTAIRVGATVSAAAAAKAEQTAHAAVLVARAVAAAADAVAATTAAAADAMEHEVRDAAIAMRTLTAATAQQLATDTVERAAALALATHEAAAASERLHAAANLQLQQAGRHDRSVARALQTAMLTQLPESANLQMAARYLTAAEQDQVGGDWYDAVVRPTGSTVLVIGDVVGHDIAAAAMMGQLRNMLRALIWDRNEPPSAVVARLDRAIRDLRVNTMATLAVVSIEQSAPDQHAGARTLRWTNAGHPAPILIYTDGTAVALEDTTDILLGVLPDTDRRDHTHLVPPGATLLLYTDGLIETPVQDIDTGKERLLATLRTHHRLEPGELLDAVLADMVGEQKATDDVAVLAVRFQNTRVGGSSTASRCR